MNDDIFEQVIVLNLTSSVRSRDAPSRLAFDDSVASRSHPRRGWTSWCSLRLGAEKGGATKRRRRAWSGPMYIVRIAPTPSRSAPTAIKAAEGEGGLLQNKTRRGAHHRRRFSLVPFRSALSLALSLFTLDNALSRLLRCRHRRRLLRRPPREQLLEMCASRGP